MRNRVIAVSEIIRFLGEEDVIVYGPFQGVTIDNLADVKHVTSSTLDWVKDGPGSQQIAESSLAKVMIVGPSVVYNDYLQRCGKVLLQVAKPKVTFARIGNHFFVTHRIPGIHPTAIVSSDAVLGDRVYIGPYCVIGAVSIGDDCIIDSNVRIYDEVTLGNNCCIKAGAVIGGEGFGFERDEHGNKFRFPQIGRVVIGNDVEIGANTCIDRGALSDTVIGDYTKINNLCHIAHNNKIGKNVTVAGCVNVSGSNTIEDNVWIAPHACIRGFLTLGEKCVIGMGAIVTKDVPAGETWVGNPAHKMEKK